MVIQANRVMIVKGWLRQIGAPFKTSSKSRPKYAVFECDCGTRKIIQVNHVKSSHTSSCGCLKKEVDKGRFDNLNKSGIHVIHGESGTAEQRCWHAMLARCYNEKNKSYPNYGGRGITVCDRWRNSLEDFIIDMGRKPKSSLSIDRIDNDGNYEPANCRWATCKQQSRNRRSSRLLTVNGDSKIVAEWSEILGIGISVIWSRLWRGWNESDALLTPVESRRRRK